MHYSQELPLVFFTLLAQMAVGIVFVGQCILPRRGDAPEYAPVFQCVRKQSPVALALLGAGALASLSHTGSPFNAFFTLFNVSSSWLSREIALMGVTGLCMLWLTITHFKALRATSPGNPVKEGQAGLITWVAGLVLVFVMSSVYSQKTMPGWYNTGVLLSFDASMLLLGGLWMGVALSRSSRGGQGIPAAALAKTLALTMLGLVGMGVSLPLMVPPALGSAAGASLNPATILPYAELVPWHARHAALTGFGVLFFVLATLRAVMGMGGMGAQGSGGARLHPGLTLAAFVMVFVGEVLGRIGFYLSYSRLGM